jgi:predicted DNA-binding protein
MKKIKDERFTVRLPDKTRTIIQWLAQHYNKSESEMVRVLLERGLRTLLPADLVEFEVSISTQVSRIFEEVSQQ